MLGIGGRGRVGCGRHCIDARDGGGIPFGICSAGMLGGEVNGVVYDAV